MKEDWTTWVGQPAPGRYGEYDTYLLEERHDDRDPVHVDRMCSRNYKDPHETFQRRYLCLSLLRFVVVPIRSRTPWREMRISRKEVCNTKHKTNERLKDCLIALIVEHQVRKVWRLCKHLLHRTPVRSKLQPAPPACRAGTGQGGGPANSSQVPVTSHQQDFQELIDT